MSILSNFDLENILNNLQIQCYGIFFKNQLPTQAKKGNYIINMSNSDTNGSHWVCFIIKDAKTCYYFDSFATPPPLEVMKFCGKRTIIYNDIQIQANTSTCCGWFCVGFLLHAKLKDKLFLSEYVNMFKHNKYLNQNDRILKNYINRYLK